MDTGDQVFASRRGKAALALNPSPSISFRAATDAKMLPQPEPPAMRDLVIVPAIRSREITQAQRTGVRHFEDSLKALDFGNGLLGVHSVSISIMGVAIVKRCGTLGCVLTLC
jgi:hypothetical protein